MYLWRIVAFIVGFFTFMYSEMALGNYSCCNTFSEISPIYWIVGIVVGLILMAPLVMVLKKND